MTILKYDFLLAFRSFLCPNMLKWQINNFQSWTENILKHAITKLNAKLHF